MNRFSSEHREKLGKIFIRLVDFIHRRKIEQLVGCGPSAYPYTIAVARAYRNRHGKELKVVNLGTVGEGLVSFASPPVVEKVLKRKVPGFAFDKKTMLLEEVSKTGSTLKGLSDYLSQLGVNNLTAALLKFGSREFLALHRPHFVGAKICAFDPLERAVFIGRGQKFEVRDWKGKMIRPLNSWLDFMAQLHRELAEIADSVPKKN